MTASWNAIGRNDLTSCIGVTGMRHGVKDFCLAQPLGPNTARARERQGEITLLSPSTVVIVVSAWDDEMRWLCDGGFHAHLPCTFHLTMYADRYFMIGR